MGVTLLVNSLHRDAEYQSPETVLIPRMKLKAWRMETQVTPLGPEASNTPYYIGDSNADNKVRYQIKIGRPSLDEIFNVIRFRRAILQGLPDISEPMGGASCVKAHTSEKTPNLPIDN